VGGVSFDRAADYYDATRGLSVEARNALTDVLAAELSGRGVALEIGVGTGRIALPLHERGFDLIGTDISSAMLRRLIANARGTHPIPLMLADATRLPLAALSFDAAIASHVLHLIPQWRLAVDEAMRVLRPEGELLVDFGGGTAAPWSAQSKRLLRHHGVVEIRPGVSVPDEVAGYLGGRASLRRLPGVTMAVRRSLRQDLEEWENQIHAWTWRYSAQQMREASAAVRAWASDHAANLDEEVELERSIQWWCFVKHG
jgi:ubiquinone/menaquinone biosynthesis C-methylase UbiE